MARLKKYDLLKQMMAKIESINLLSQDILVAHSFYKKSFADSLRVTDIKDSMRDLSNAENTLYILEGKFKERMKDG